MTATNLSGSPIPPPFTVWVDADACPVPIKEFLIKTAKNRQLQMIFVSNKLITVPNSPLFQAVQVSHGADVADAYIVEHTQAGDIVITQDIPLAALLVGKNVLVLNLKGDWLKGSNIAERLAVRNLMTDLRDTGMITGGPKPFSQKQKETFANGFDKVLTFRLKQG
jgi:uncharacterized protein YaiI (UPF0178 family)